MIDYGKLEALYQLKNLFDLILDPVKLKQTTTEIQTYLNEINVKLGLIKNMADVDERAKNINRDLDRRSQEVAKSKAEVEITAANHTAKHEERVNYLTNLQNTLQKQSSDLDKQRQAQVVAQADLDARGIALRAAEEANKAATIQLNADRKAMDTKMAQLKSIAGN